MYTLHMSWSFRALALTVVLAWGLVPQLACFMQEQTVTPAEMDCCQKMANNCGAPSMSQTCCRPVGRTDIGIAAKPIRSMMPRSDTAELTTDIVLFSTLRFPCELSNPGDHAPPDQSALSSVVLRI
jgi:hypothetical protein